jgi:hypothetical protein
MTPESSPPPRSPDELLLELVRSQEIACPVCGYNLHGLTMPRCPECGRNLKLTLGAMEPYLTAWITAAIATFGSSGIALLLDCFAAAKGVHLRDIVQLAAFFCFNLSPPLALAAVLWRRFFVRAPWPLQWTLAAFCVLLTMGQITFFVVAVP